MSVNDSDHSTVNQETNIVRVSEDEDDGSEVNESGKRSRGSEIWNYFEKVERGSGSNSQLAICAVPKCKSKPYSCGKSSTTKSLWRHLQNAHWGLYVNTEEYQKRKKEKTDSGSLEEFWKARTETYLVLIALILNLLTILDYRRSRDLEAKCRRFRLLLIMRNCER
jgi:hypothetical protein